MYIVLVLKPNATFLLWPIFNPMNHKLRNLLENSQRTALSLVDLIEFLKRLENPPNDVAAAYLNEPVFGNSFDGVNIAPKLEGTKKDIGSAFLA